MSTRSGLLTAVAFLFCVGQALSAQDQDVEVLSAAIAHYSNSNNHPLLVVAGETLEASRIILDRYERDGSPDTSGAIIQALRERNSNVQSVGDVRLPPNAVLVRDALSLIRRFTQSGAEVSDWSPFTHAYPGYRLVQFAAPAYLTPGQRALVYLAAASGAEEFEGTIYILEKRAGQWHVTSSDSPWRAAASV
jgi:hypothetical protein